MVPENCEHQWIGSISRGRNAENDVGFAIVRLEHRSLSPRGEKFVRLTVEADADLTEFEQKQP
jgi:hypothetical protein